MSASNIIKTMPDDMLNIKSNVVTKPSNEPFKFFFAFLEKKVEQSLDMKRVIQEFMKRARKFPEVIILHHLVVSFGA
jgi:hypothetical protein